MSAMHHPTQVVTSIRDATRKYKAVLLDQFGVLHDGKVAFPEAIEAVKELAGASKKVYILSNSSRRVATALQKISSLGFPAECFAGGMTSGEVTHQFLLKRPTLEWDRLGTRCLHFTWGSRGAVDISSLGLTAVMSPAECEFILAHGTEGLGSPDGDVQLQSTEALQELMAECAALGGRPMVVANPDFVTVSGNELIPMPGSLARYYAGKGGEVRVMGKPSTVIYQMALDEMQVAANEVVAIGDSMEHDIAGAAAMGIDSLFVAGGIHAEHFKGETQGELLVTETYLERMREQDDVAPTSMPTYAIDYLRW